jgi:geranylgeranyl diphosphate synthase, type II
MFSHEYLRDISDRAISGLSSNTDADRLFDPVKYILSQGGKRIRPVLCLMACNLFSDKIDEAIMPAVGIEVFHNFTLVHDDIIDKAEMRRSVPTVHSKWGLNQALLSGDVMVFVSTDCISQSPEKVLGKLLRLFNKTAIEVCAGQQLDIDFEKKTIVTGEEYIRMIELKTAVLIAASLKIGAIIGNASENDQNLLYEFGRCLGLAFQIQDDLLDTYGDTKIFGKKTGGDIIANKKTWLLVKALEQTDGEQLVKLKSLLSQKKFNPEEKVKEVVEIYDSLNLRLQAENLSYEYINKAFESLDAVSVKETRKTDLKQLATNLIGRDR